MEQHNVKFKNSVYLREKEACDNKCNVLRRAGSDYCVNNFPGTFADCRFKKLTQEIISSYADSCL